MPLLAIGCGGRSLLNGPEGEGAPQIPCSAMGGRSSPRPTRPSPRSTPAKTTGDTGGGHIDTGIFFFDSGRPDTGFVFDAEVPIDTGIDTSLPADAGPYPAAFPTPPQVLNQGGQVLSSPKIIALMFSNDDPSEVPEIQDFFMGITESAYWAGLEEYNVGPAQPTQIVNLTEAAPTSIDDSAQGGQSSALQTWLAGEISTGNVPPPDANTRRT